MKKIVSGFFMSVVLLVSAASVSAQGKDVVDIAIRIPCAYHTGCCS